MNIGTEAGVCASLVVKVICSLPASQPASQTVFAVYVFRFFSFLVRFWMAERSVSGAAVQLCVIFNSIVFPCSESSDFLGVLTQEAKITIRIHGRILAASRTDNTRRVQVTSNIRREERSSHQPT